MLVSILNYERYLTLHLQCMADLDILNMVIVTAMKDMDRDVDKDVDVDGDRIHLLQPQRERRKNKQEAVRMMVDARYLMST